MASDATATTGRDSGETTGGDKNGKGAKLVPGYSGTGQTSSQSHSTATGSTGCDGNTACQAQISATASTSGSTDDDPANRFATTNASVTAATDNGTEAGCATRTSSTTTTVAGNETAAKATATCAISNGSPTGTDTSSTCARRIRCRSAGSSGAHCPNRRSPGRKRHERRWSGSVGRSAC